MPTETLSELDALRARVRVLEQENASLHAASPFADSALIPARRASVARAHASYEDLSRSFAATARALASTRQHLSAKLDELAEESAGHREVLRRLERTQTALDGIASMVVWLRPSGRLAYVNESACQRLGYSAEDCQGMLLTDIDTQLGPDELDGMWARMRETGAATLRSVLRTRTGETIPVQIHASYFAQQDERLAFCFVEDISEALALERQLECERSAAERIAHTKAELLATMSHELRTPLSAVVGMTELLLQTPLDSEQREFAEIAREASDHLHHLIDHVLEFSRLEARVVELEQEVCEVRALCSTSLGIVDTLARAKGLPVLLHVDESVPSRVLTDVGRLRQLLLNLLSNAIKFTAQGQVELRVDATPTISGRSTLGFEIHDTGPGIDFDRQAEIFDSYRQASASIHRVYGGAGLGLAICRRIAELFEGTLTVRSEIGRGAVFRFAFETEVLEP